MRLIFLGSPEAVVAPLAALHAQAAEHGHELVGVVSQPARPVGRSGRVQDPPVAATAKSLGLPTLQPEKASDPGFLAEFAALAPDVAITAAYGQILTPAFLRLPRRATINIHPSLLPRYRGATPVPAALLAGDTVTGVSVLFTVQKLDAGALIVQESSPIAAAETTETLTKRLFASSSRLVFAALAKLADPGFTGTPQDEASVTLCRKIVKGDGNVLWSSPGDQIVQRFRAYQPWPGSFTWFGAKRVSLLDVRPGPSDGPSLAPGQVRFDKPSRLLYVGTASTSVLVAQLQLAGGKAIDAAAFWNGLKDRDSVAFNEGPV